MTGGPWDKIKSDWLKAYRNREIIEGFSVTKNIKPIDEWCVEAYMKTDYKSLSVDDFSNTLREFLSHCYKHKKLNQIVEDKVIKRKGGVLDVKSWKWFEIDKVFKEGIDKCKCGSADKILFDGDDIDYIGAKKRDNGLMRRVQMESSLVTEGNGIVFIGDGQGSVGYSTYQYDSFIGSTTLSVGRSKRLNQYNSIFLVTILDRERKKYSFGRKWFGYKLRNTKIKLPTTESNEPDWKFMERYIKSLSYSKNLESIKLKERKTVKKKTDTKPRQPNEKNPIYGMGFHEVMARGARVKKPKS